VPNFERARRLQPDREKRLCQGMLSNTRTENRKSKQESVLTVMSASLIKGYLQILRVMCETRQCWQHGPRLAAPQQISVSKEVCATF
jgi:hypothetical protein